MRPLDDSVFFSPQSLGMSPQAQNSVEAILSNDDNEFIPSAFIPASTPVTLDGTPPSSALLKLHDGTAFYGYSFGANKSVAGECVFQTGMVGYVQSLTDPSYRGQLLVLTYPLIGNYGVPLDEVDKNLNNLLQHFESSQIHISGLVIGECSPKYSHYLAKSSLNIWLKENGIPGIYGVDTRLLTKKIRMQGVTLGKLVMTKLNHRLIPENSLCEEEFEDVAWWDPNETNLVAEVSTKEILSYYPRPEKALRNLNGKPLKVLILDFGMKYNQLRNLLERGLEVKVVPWDYDFLSDSDYDGMFLSNGPGDPQSISITVERLRKKLAQADKPIFGICLGHQVLALAAGAKTRKMLFGNRGVNIPCKQLESGKCFITSQNHGFEVDASSLPEDWKETFQNLNDLSNEGIQHKKLPYFSVQFHPEAKAGPLDTEFLFDQFVDCIRHSSNTGELAPLPLLKAVDIKRQEVNKVLILGSGGLSIGQAGEFDYSGSQAIKALKQEGIYTILMNPNIATIQTSKGLADKVYFLPVTPDYVRKVIEYEKPDGIYVTFGGQTALNVGVAMYKEFDELGIKVLGTPIETIMWTEDRELFANKMQEIGEKCAPSKTANHLQEALEAVEQIGYPVIIRAAYALGGLGSGFASNREEFIDLCQKAFGCVSQILVEKSLKGWKEVEYEVVRDSIDNCITVCNMENFDPLGIHTGDSIVVAPSQTLSDHDYNMLRSTAIKVIRHLKVVGECNIQYALDPNSDEYYIIEVNARLSRSSALASKATGYPLAFVAAKLGLGIPLTEIKNNVTLSTVACFEPSLDYVVIKMPRWDLKKFSRVRTKIGSAMKSVGEVMSIGRNLEEAFQKAIQSVDGSFPGFSQNDLLAASDDSLAEATDLRIFAIANAFHSGYTVERIAHLTKIDKWFLEKLFNIFEVEKELSSHTTPSISVPLLRKAKCYGFSDKQISKLINTTELSIRKLRHDKNILPFVKQIDTVSAEFPASTNYLYMTYNASENDISFNDHGIMVLGSGVYRIGSSVEFDWCAVGAIRTLRKLGYKTIMVNYNPETVSTDYDEADRLYFENISLERVMDIYEMEKSSGAILAMGGQTSNNIALPLFRLGVKILGTSPQMIDMAENRYKFSRMLDDIGVDQPRWKELTNVDEAANFCKEVEYPVLVRPSYVLSGAAMNVVSSENDLESYLSQATAVSRDFPVVISKFIEEAKEIEVDAVAKEGELVMHVISEHVENAGVHSGDATLILPPQDLDQETIDKVTSATAKIASALNVTGPFNIQFIAKNKFIKVIECNLRASRSFPFASKVTNVDLIEMSVKAMISHPIIPYPNLGKPLDYIGVKVAQFSFSRLIGADPVLGVEMASTGEVACFGKTKHEAYMKALVATGFCLPKKNILISIGSYKEKVEFLPSAAKLHQLGFKLFATKGTTDFLQEHNIPVQYLEELDCAKGDQRPEFSLSEHLANNLIDLYINLPSKNRFRRPSSYVSGGYRSRRMAVDFSVPLMTNIKCAKLFVEALSMPTLLVSDLDYKTTHSNIVLPGLVCIRPLRIPSDFKPDQIQDYIKKSLGAGLTVVNIAVDSGHSLSHAFESQPQYCDYWFTDSFSGKQEKSLATPSLYLDMKSATANTCHLLQLFKDWKRPLPLISSASDCDLSSVLLLASLHGIRVHIINVKSMEDIELIRVAKEKGIAVTCEVCVRSIFPLPDSPSSNITKKSDEDRLALWKHISVIDCFSLLEDHDEAADAQLSLRLLFQAYQFGQLTLEDIIKRTYDQPRAIFDLPEQPETSVLFELQPVSEKKSKAISDVGRVHRVVIKGSTVYLDGSYFLKEAHGSNVTETISMIATTSALSLSTKDLGISDISNKSSALSPAPTTPVSKAPRAKALSLSVAQLSDLAHLPRSAFHQKHIISSKSFSKQDLHILFSVAHLCRNSIENHRSIDILKGKILCTAFFEPSTRTSMSFETAMIRLGGTVVSLNESGSSMAKGEAISDTVRTLCTYCDGIVWRHPAVGSSTEAANFSSVPLINGGDGAGEHPTQAFLDIFTIREEMGTVNGLTITLVGDLKHGRTVHSLVRLLSHYKVTLNYVSPSSLGMPSDIMEELRHKGIPQRTFEQLDEAVMSQTHVLYMTRVQKERFETLEHYEQVKESFRLDSRLMAKAGAHMIVMHPLPRIQEIDPELDYDDRAAYFRQMKYGLYVRMALLALVYG